MTLLLLGRSCSKSSSALVFISSCWNCLLVAVDEPCSVSALDTDHSFVKSRTGVPLPPSWCLTFIVSQCWELVGTLVHNNSILSYHPLLFGAPRRDSQDHRPVASLLSCVGLWMLGLTSPSWIRLGKVFRILEPLDGHISASDWVVVQGLKPLPPPPRFPPPHP